MQTFLPWPDLTASVAVLDDRRLGKQRVEVFQVLRALTWPTYAWKNHPAVRMWRGFVPGLVAYGVACCREWTRRGYADSVLPQLLAWTGGVEPVDPALPPWFGLAELHLSHRSSLLRKDPAFYRPLFGEDDPDDLPYLWPPDVFPRWPLRARADLAGALAELGLDAARPWQAAAVEALQEGRDVLLVARPGAGGRTTGLLAGLVLPGRTAVLAPPLGPLAGPAPDLPPLPVRTVVPPTDADGAATPPRAREAEDEAPAPSREAVARPPSTADLEAMAAEAEPSAWSFGTGPEALAGPALGLVVLAAADDLPALGPRPSAVPVLAVVHRADAAQRDELVTRHGLHAPEQVGGGWDLAATLAELPPGYDSLAAEVRQATPCLVVVADRRRADRVVLALRGRGLRAVAWAPQSRADRAADAVRQWRTRRLDALVVPDGPLPPLGRVRPVGVVHADGADDLEQWRSVVASLDPQRAALAAAGTGAAAWAAAPGCRHVALLATYGEPVVMPCGRCDRCCADGEALVGRTH